MANNKTGSQQGQMMRTMIMAKRAFVGAVLAGAAALAATTASAGEGDLSDKSVQVIMDYAWALTPQQFSKKDGTVIVVDKSKRDAVMVPLDVAREVVRVARISAHAQVCNLPEEQTLNHRSLMRREVDKKKWTDQQTLYINQLHLTTVMLLSGKIKLVEKDGDKDVVVDEKQQPQQTCTDEQRQKVKDLVAAYVKAGPSLASNEKAASPEPTGSAAPPAQKK
jgi:Spy/CpxP family protein refolding chaperone